MGLVGDERQGGRVFSATSVTEKPRLAPGHLLVSLRPRNRHPWRSWLVASAHEAAGSFTWNVLLLKIFAVWESMFKFDLLDPLHIPVYCSGFSSRSKETSSEMALRAFCLHLWHSLPIVKTDLL